MKLIKGVLDYVGLALPVSLIAAMGTSILSSLLGVGNPVFVASVTFFVTYAVTAIAFIHPSVKRGGR